MTKSPANLADRWFKDATPEQKQAAVHILLAVATGDGRLTPEEKRAIAEACTRMGVSSFNVAAAIVSGMPEDVDPPTSRADRIRLLTDAVVVMVADRRIDDRELAVILMVGANLGFSADEVHDLIAKVVRAAQAEERREAVIRRLLDE
jgi:tellurite resistance protein